MGDVLTVALLVSEMDCQPEPQPLAALFSIDETGYLKSWYQVSEQNCTEQFQVTPIGWNPFADQLVQLVANKSLRFIVGTEQCHWREDYCNGALKKSTRYALMARVFTRSGFSDTNPIFFKTDKRTDMLPLIVLGSILFPLLLTIGLIIICCKMKSDK